MTIFSVGIVVHSDSLTADELSELIGIEPTKSFTKGDPISPRVPSSKALRRISMWSKKSGIKTDSWTLEPHWSAIAPVLFALARIDPGADLRSKLSIGTSARASGFAFDITPEQATLLGRARCGIWIDSYEPNRDHNDRPDDYPFAGTLSPPGRLRRARNRVNLLLRNVNPFGKVRRNRRKSETTSTA